MLATLRDQVNPMGSNPMAVQIDPDEAKQAAAYFSEMPLQSLQNPPALPAAPTPPPPAPGNP